MLSREHMRRIDSKAIRANSLKQQNISGKGDLAYISTTLKFRNTQSNLNPYLSNLDQTASQGKTYRIKTFFQNSEKYRLSHWQTLSMKPRIHLKYGFCKKSLRKNETLTS